MIHSRRITHFVAVALTLSFYAPSAWCDTTPGSWGIGGFGTAAVPLGVTRTRKEGEVGTDAGGTVRYNLTERWGIGASYDNIYLQNGIRREPLTLSALYYDRTDRRWAPVSEFGLGAASSNPGGPFNNFSIKFGMGAEYFLTPILAFEPLLNFHYITAVGSAPFRCVVMSPGVLALLYFK